MKLEELVCKEGPFEILGIPKDSDQDAIKKRYREWMIYLHPDENKEYIEDRGYILQIIQDAYQKCMNVYQERDYPKDNMKYSHNEKIYFDNTVVKKKKNGTTKKINKNFHEKFEKVKEILDKEDPEKIGYNEFTPKINREVVYKEYEILDDVVFKSAEYEYGKKDSTDIIIPGQFGIVKIDNFYIKTDNLEASDLKEAFSNKFLHDEIDNFVVQDTEKRYNEIIMERDEPILPRIYEDTPLLKNIREAREHVDIQHKRDLSRGTILSRFIENN